MLAKVYDEIGTDVYRYLSVLMGSSERAEDVMQEVFLRLVRVVKRDPGAAQNRAYVFKVARHEAYRAIGKRKRGVPTADDHLLEISDPSRGSEGERLMLQEALVKLPESQREVVHLKVYMNMTFNEIGQMTNVPLETAASRYRYALEKLRELLSDMEEHRHES
jgi:RNA polymerase sigma-70 factor (ECF subfamily)